MFRSIVVVLILFVAPPAYAENRTVTIRGPLLVGSSDSGIEGLSHGCVFLTDSDIAQTVFSTCKFQDECEITGIIDQNENLLSIFKIRKIDINNEPSNSVIISAACWASSIDQSLNSKSLSVVSLEILESYSEILNEETFWSYKYKLTINAKGNPETTQPHPAIVRIVKRGDTWQYYR